MTELATLLASDPHGHSDQDIDQIIKAMREARAQFKAGSMTAGNLKPKTGKAKQAAEATDQLSLKDLGL